MATNAKIIKLGNGSLTYVPITTTNAIQHSYGSNSHVVLESYLGDIQSYLVDIQSGVSKNATDIGTLASAVLNTYTKIVDYENSYVKPVSGRNDQIMVHLPTTGTNEYQDTITINNVANATTATNLENAPSLSKTAASGANTDSFNVTAGGKTGATAVTLSKASDTTYGVVKLGDLALAGHTHTSELSVNTADATITYNTGDEGAKTTQAYKGGTAYGFVKVDSSVSDISENPVQNKVIKKYADDTFLTKTEFESFSASGMHYKGDTATVPSSPTSGDVYHVTTKITSGLGTGVTAEVGDFITYYKPEGGTGSWSVWDKNVDKAIYAGNNTLTTGQMLVTDGTDGKVKSQAIPTVSVSGSGTGNVVKTISNDDHAISYTMGYAIDTLSKSGDNAGVITSVTKSNNTLTVTYTDASSSFSGGSTLKTVTGYTQNASGKITNVTFGDISTMGPASTGSAGSAGLVPAPAVGDVTATVVKVLGADGNWKTISATTPTLTHSVTPNLKYSVGSADIELADIFGSFTDGPDIVTIADHAAGSVVPVSIS